MPQNRAVVEAESQNATVLKDLAQRSADSGGDGVNHAGTVRPNFDDTPIDNKENKAKNSKYQKLLPVFF